MGRSASRSAPTGLKQLIKLKFVEAQDKPVMTAETWLRVSGLSSLCAREEVLASLLQIERKNTVDADLSLIFAHGKALHWVLQNEILPAAGVLIGVWRCLACGSEHGGLEEDGTIGGGLISRPTVCGRLGCYNEEFLYLEQHFTNEEYRVGGHPDGFIVLPEMTGIGIIECKSISSGRAWEVRHTPDISHAIQAQAYMWLTGLQWAKILYWEKGGQGLGALAEHTVERDEDTITEIQTLIRTIRAGITSGMLPERICTDKSCPRAKKCDLVAQCFKDAEG